MPWPGAAHPAEEEEKSHRDHWGFTRLGSTQGITEHSRCCHPPPAAAQQRRIGFQFEAQRSFLSFFFLSRTFWEPPPQPSRTLSWPIYSGWVVRLSRQGRAGQDCSFGEQDGAFGARRIGYPVGFGFGLEDDVQHQIAPSWQRRERGCRKWERAMDTQPVASMARLVLGPLLPAMEQHQRQQHGFALQ